MPHVTPRPHPGPLPPDCALFLDVDGALLEFADAPDGVVVPEGLVARLAALAVQRDGALALVSGRDVATLDKLFAPLALACAGLHGLQRRHGGGAHAASVVDTIDAPARMDEIRAAAREVVAKYPGTLIEEKGPAIAFHWRADPLAAADFEGLAAMAAMELPGYHLQHGNHVVELRPAGADKGSAIEAFMREAPFAGRVPVFAGDDLTDEHGFEVVNRLGGSSVLVGAREPSQARCGLADPAAVRAWLGVAEPDRAA